MSKPNYQGFYNIVMNEASSEATIYIYGVIGGFDFDKWEYINTANQFKDDFAEVEAKAELINVKINSPGGSIWDGLPIYNTLKNSKKKVHTYVDGIAYSMASLIAMAGDKVYGYSNSMLMFHNGLNYVYGNAKELRESADTLDQYDEALSSIIEERLNISDSEVKEKYLNYSDNYFVGKKAKNLGFFDEIITTKKADLPDNVKKMSPQDLMRHYSAMNFKPFDANNTNTNSINMKTKTYTALIEVLGVESLESNENGVYLNEEQLATINQNITDATANVATAQSQQSAADALLASANQDLATIGTAIQDALTAAEVNEAQDIQAVDGVAQLSALIAEYGSKDGDEATNVPAGTEGADDENPNIVGGIDISEAMNC